MNPEPRTIVRNLSLAFQKRPRAPYCSICGEHVPECHKSAVACACTIHCLEAAYGIAFNVYAPATARMPVELRRCHFGDPKSSETMEGEKVAPAQSQGPSQPSEGAEQVPNWRAKPKLAPDDHARRILTYEPTRAKSLLFLHKKYSQWKHVNWMLVEEGLRRHGAVRT